MKQFMVKELLDRYEKALQEAIYYKSRVNRHEDDLRKANREAQQLRVNIHLLEAGDYGRPAALQTASVLEGVFENITRNVVQETVNRNETLPPTEAIKITTMAGCSAVKK